MKKALALRYRDESGTVGLPAGSLLKTTLAQSSYQQLELGRRRYELSNHLGNVLATVSDKSLGQDSSQTGQADYYLAQVSSASLYYPFGWEMPGRKFVSGEGYRFGFNGQEEDPDIHGGGIVFKYRTEDARVARFFAVDPIAAQYPELTPYQVASLSPIYMIELEGLEGFPVHGTFMDKSFFSEGGYVETKLRDLFGNTDVKIPVMNDDEGNEVSVWDGENDVYSRLDGGANLAKYIVENRIAGEDITIVGHSHGGNVGIWATHILVNKYDVDPQEINLVLLNTPERYSDFNMYYRSNKAVRMIKNNSSGDEIWVKHPFLPPAEIRTYEIDADWDLVKGAGESWWPGKKLPQSYPSGTNWGEVYDYRANYKDQYTGWKVGVVLGVIAYPYIENSASTGNHMGHWKNNVNEWFPGLEKAVKESQGKK